MLTTISPQAITGSYEGYYWLSDANKPEFWQEPKPLSDVPFTQALPFIIEANFYDPETDISLSVKTLDGQCHITKIDLSQWPSAHKIERTYESILNHDGKKAFDEESEVRIPFRMYELWREVDGGPNLANMKTLVPSLSAFAGFLPSRGRQAR